MKCSGVFYLPVESALAPEADEPEAVFLSEGTVRNHLSAAIQKIGARNRGQAARIAGQKGWL